MVRSYKISNDAFVVFYSEYNSIHKWRVTVGMHDTKANEPSKLDIPIRAIIKVRIAVSLLQNVTDCVIYLCIC